MTTSKFTGLAMALRQAEAGTLIHRLAIRGFVPGGGS
jgi:hypothetical protein